MSARPMDQAPDATEGTLDREHPWLGLASFGERDRDFFFGREVESEALRRLVGRDRLTVLFGKSGLGKTSLLKAGLFPRLRLDSMLPVYVRLGYSAGAGPLRTQVLDAVERTAAEAGVEAPARGETASLWEYFHRRDADFWSARQRLVTPVLVLDQFEEIFTVGVERMPDECRDFLSELSDLVEGRPAQALRNRFDEHPEDADRFSFARHPYRVLLALREDFLADLEGVRDRMPSVVSNRFRLRGMGSVEALQVVVGPGGRLVEPDVAERIVRFVAGAPDDGQDLAGLTVEPALLSLFCHELNARRLERRLDRITDDLLKGSQAGILSEFYTRSLKDLGGPVRDLVEERLVTESGYRDSMAVERALATPGVAQSDIDRLVERRLLRTEERDGVRRLELTHDVLIDVIRRSRDQRRARARARKRSAVAFVATATVLAVSGVLLVREVRQRARAADAEDWQVAVTAVGAALGSGPDSAAWTVMNSARRSWDSAAAAGLDSTGRAAAVTRTVEATRDSLRRETTERITGLARRLDADSAAARQAALADLYAYSGDPFAVSEALALLDSSQADGASNAGRINALTFLRNTRPSAWDRDLLEHGRTALRSIRGQGPQTLDARNQAIDHLDRIELALTTVYIQFADERDRQQIEALRQRLLEAGLTVPGIELRPPDFPDQVRYFFDDDEFVARRVEQLVERVQYDAGRPVDLEVKRLRLGSARPGTVEIWIGLSGRGGR